MNKINRRLFCHIHFWVIIDKNQRSLQLSTLFEICIRIVRQKTLPYRFHWLLSINKFICIHMKTLIVRDQTCGLIQIQYIICLDKRNSLILLIFIDVFRIMFWHGGPAGHFLRRLRKMQWPKPWQGARYDVDEWHRYVGKVLFFLWKNHGPKKRLVFCWSSQPCCVKTWSPLSPVVFFL